MTAALQSGTIVSSLFPSSFPTLSQIGLPVTKRLVLSFMLREIVLALSCLYPNYGILSYQTHRWTSGELVKVTRSKNKESFVTNVRYHQSWLHPLPSLVVAESFDSSVGAITMTEQWNGIGDFLEDFIEQEHQFGMKEEKQTANMRDCG
jgi:hypothetical protein